MEQVEETDNQGFGRGRFWRMGQEKEWEEDKTTGAPRSESAGGQVPELRVKEEKEESEVEDIEEMEDKAPIASQGAANAQSLLNRPLGRRTRSKAGRCLIGEGIRKFVPVEPLEFSDAVKIPAEYRGAILLDFNFPHLLKGMRDNTVELIGIKAFILQEWHPFGQEGAQPPGFGSQLLLVWVCIIRKENAN